MKVQPFLILCLIFLISCAPQLIRKNIYDFSKMDKPTRRAYQRVEHVLNKCIRFGEPIECSEYSVIDTIIFDNVQKNIRVDFNNIFAFRPFREENTRLFQDAVEKELESDFKGYTVSLYALNTTLQELIPNYYRSRKSSYDLSRMPERVPARGPFIINLDRPVQITNGLSGRILAIWPSHGWYYENRLDRWEWQRARVFQTVEDLLPMAFVVPYLAPMLENAGAVVMIPRERDVQPREVIIDNDDRSLPSLYRERGEWRTADKAGFAPGHPPYGKGINPFELGTSRRTIAQHQPDARIDWIPDIPRPGRYAVYVSFAQSDSNVSDARYTVYHCGGRTRFSINQRMGGGTWIYLGHFYFEKGINPGRGRVGLTNASQEAGKFVSADGVRFGGGMGNVERNGQISGRPRFAEAARYYLQYAGFPDSLVYNLNGDSIDYNDDYQCRGEWVNFLQGAPGGPNGNRQAEGLKLPVDLSLAFHTDAGSSKSDTTIGTLMIYSSSGADTAMVFPDSVSRFASRDFADILQTQIVRDIRAKYDSIWTRRGLWDRRYSEAYRPNVPAALLELLSHHNFLDMKFALDPRFRFDVSRSVYKGILKFLANQYQREYIVQPLPVTHLRAEFSGNDQIRLTWQASVDSLEPTAGADQFIVYMRKNEGGFDNGRLVDQPAFVLRGAQPDTIYSFKVTAVNRGGESFPSEILALGRPDHSKGTVLVINAFDRISGPAVLESEQYAGFAGFWDQGVADGYEFSYVGDQYDFSCDSQWLDDDAPGHGASHARWETKLIAGNTHDFTIIHGRAVMAAGYGFESISDEAFADGIGNPEHYILLDLLLGEEKISDWPKPRKDKQFRAFPPPLQDALREYAENGGGLFVSGAYVGSDLFENSSDSTDKLFATEILKFRHRTDHAAETGEVHAVHNFFIERTPRLTFNTVFNDSIYAVESPDAVEAADSTARTIFRYSENNTSAGIASIGRWRTVVLGFPFETVTGGAARRALMQSIIEFCLTKKRLAVQ